MRISDWSSDVCSSDLLPVAFLAEQAGGIEQEVARVVGPALDAVAPEAKGGLFLQRRIGRQCRVRLLVAGQHGGLDAPLAAGGVELLDAVGPVALRSDERRVGQEWVSTGKYRCAPLP